MQVNLAILTYSISDGGNNGKANLVRTFVFLSFLIWLIATSILRLWGHTFFIPSALIMSDNFLWSLFFLPPLVYGIFGGRTYCLNSARMPRFVWQFQECCPDHVPLPAVFNMLPSVDGAFEHGCFGICNCADNRADY